MITRAIRASFFSDQTRTANPDGSTLNQKSYVKLVEGDEHGLIDIRDLERRRREGNAFNNRDREAIYKDTSVTTADAIEMDGFASGIGGSIGHMAVAKAARSMNAPMAQTAAFSGANGSFLATREKSDLQKEMPAPMAMPAMPASPPAGAPSTEPAVQVRSDFRSTVFWQPDVITGKDGKATVKVTYPDSLTGWKATARAVTGVNQFGIAEAATHTKQPLIVRLEAPRFFVVGDEAIISAVVNNNTDRELIVRPELEQSGVSSVLRLEPAASLTVPANGEARADWPVKFSQPGETKLKVTGRGGKYADAMEKGFTVYEHGIEKFVSKSGKVRGEDVTVKLNLPRERKDGTTSLSVQVTLEHGGDDARCAALPDQLPVRLHRADHEPVFAGGHHRQNAKRPGLETRRRDGACIRRH